MMKVLHLTRQRRWRGGVFGLQALGLLVASLGLSVNAAAQEEEYEAMAMEDLLRVPVRVAAASTEQAGDVFSTPSAVTIIDKATIQRYGFQNLAEALTIVPGMSVYRTYFRRNIPTARGVTQFNYANKVLLMINGVPTWMAITGESILDRVSIHDLERIEVLKGPASVIYGSNAYSGAINLVLKESAEFDDMDIQMEAKVGTEDAVEASARYISEDEEARTFVSAGGRKEEGQDDTFTDESGLTGNYQEFVERAHATFEGKTQNHQLLVNAYNSEESHLGLVPLFALGAGKKMDTRGYLVDYKFTPTVAENSNLVLGATFDWNHVDSPRSQDLSLWSEFTGYRWVAYSRFGGKLSEQLTYNVGVNYEHRESVSQDFYLKIEDETTATAGLRDKSVYEYSVYADVSYDAGITLATLGTRVTENELFGSDVSSRVALVFPIDDTSSVKLMVGQAFRSPSLFESYVDSGAVLQGSEDLDPETSLAYELAYVGAFGDVFVQALGYYAEYDNKVFRETRVQPDGTTAPTYVNGDEFSAVGGEFELRYVAPAVADFFLNYQFVDGDDGDEVPGTDNYNFKYVPEHTLALGVAKSFGAVSTSVVANFQGEADGPNETVDDAWTFDLQLAYNQATGGDHKVRHAIVASNVFDEEVSFAEYNRLGAVNDISNGYGRRVLYTVAVAF